MSMPLPPPGQPNYQPPGYQPYAGPPARPGTSGMAIASLVCSLAGVLLCGVPAILGVIFGGVGLSQTKDNARPGRGLAIAGLIIGVVAVLAWGALWIAVAADPDHCIEFGTSNACKG